MARKKRNQDEDSGADVGMVMTCSLFLIILTFFILLNSIAVIDEHRERKALASLIGAFGSLTGGLSPSKSGDALIPATAPMEANASDIADLMQVINQPKYQHIQVGMPKEAGHAVININAQALFEENRLHLKEEAFPLLDRLGEFIKPGDYPIEVIGHTDNRVAGEKGYKSNWEISSLMALQVLKYFADQTRIDLKRMTAYGRGSRQPVASNATPLSRALNRRVEILLDYEAPDYANRIYQKKHTGIFTYKHFSFKVLNR